MWPHTILLVHNNRNLLTAHPYEVMVWAARHGYPDMVKEAAPLLLVKPLTEMVKKLPPNIAIPWVRTSRILSTPSFHPPPFRFFIMRVGGKYWKRPYSTQCG
jgi:hypothetical protein